MQTLASRLSLLARRSDGTTMPAGPTCHVVDDDPEVGRSLERLLLSAGFTPILYESGPLFSIPRRAWRPGA